MGRRMRREACGPGLDIPGCRADGLFCFGRRVMYLTNKCCRGGAHFGGLPPQGWQATCA